MHEVEPFEARLAAAVHAFADRAETKVDAMEVAERVVGRRRVGTFAWLGRPLPVVASVLITLGLLLALLAWSVQVGGPWDRRTSVVPPPAPTETPAAAPTAAATPTSTPTPVPTTDGVGPEFVSGTEVISVQTYGTSVGVDGVTQMRGVVATSVDTMNDPRVTGTGVIHGDNDSYGSVGPQWGTYRLENAEGAWEGRWTGALWGHGLVSDVTAWLVGSGAYEGYTYYFHAHGGEPVKVEGIIFPGSPPAP